MSGVSGTVITLPGQEDMVKGGGLYLHRWSTDSSGTGTKYNASSSYTITGDITLYAQWDASLEAKLIWLITKAQSSHLYKFTVTADESLSPQSLSYSGKTNVQVQLQGDTTMRTISLSGNGNLFSVSSGVTLILDNNITLKGHASNNNNLVYVASGGTLEMLEGSRITGNTSSGNSSGTNGAGVYVIGSFIMSGGEISGNTRIGGSLASFTSGNWGYLASGGGVYVGGTFTMSGGKISGNTCNATTSSSYSSSVSQG